jgi:hypothetical protein
MTLRKLFDTEYFEDNIILKRRFNLERRVIMDASAYNLIFNNIEDGLYEKSDISQFKLDLLKAYEVENNPKADKCFNLAWEYGHAYGYSEVLTYFDELMELIK